MAQSLKDGNVLMLTGLPPIKEVMGLAVSVPCALVVVRAIASLTLSEQGSKKTLHVIMF